jgi:hypothetical protein
VSLVVLECPGELGAAADAELAQVVLDGAGAEEQPGGDLPVGQVPGDQPGDLLLLRVSTAAAPGRRHFWRVDNKRTPLMRARSPQGCRSRIGRSERRAWSALFSSGSGYIATAWPKRPSVYVSLYLHRGEA